MTLLTPFGPELWIGEGPVVSFYGFPYPTRMAVIRLANGDLFLWSPIALTPELQSELAALGPVRHLVSPNAIHHLWLGQWHSAFREARLYGSPGTIKKRRDLAFAAPLGDAPEAAWADDIDQVEMQGSIALTEFVFFHRLSRTAIFADLIENFRPGWFKGWRGIVARLDGIVQPDTGAPRELRASFLRRRPARAALARILDWQAEKVILAHGDLVEQDGAAFIRRNFAWLRR